MVFQLEVKTKAWFGFHAALRDLIADWTIQLEALRALNQRVEPWSDYV